MSIRNFDSSKKSHVISTEVLGDLQGSEGAEANAPRRSGEI